MDLDLSGREFYLRSICDLLHLPAFAVLSGVFYYFLRSTGEVSNRAAFTAIFCGLLVGGSIELAQPMFERVASWQDFFYNLTGVFVGVFFTEVLLFSGTSFVRAGRSKIAFSFLSIIAFFCAQPVWSDYKDYLRKLSNIPVLGVFEAEDGTYWRPTKHLPKKPSLVGEQVYLEFAESEYSGFEYLNFSNDWSGWSRVVVSYYLPGSSAEDFHLRLDDKHSGPSYYSRYNKTVELKPGAGEVFIDLGESERDLASIKRLVLFMAPRSSKRGAVQVGSEEPRRLLLGPVKLSR